MLCKNDKLCKNDNAAPDGSSYIFRSKDSFVSGFLSNDWETKPSSGPPSNAASITQQIGCSDNGTTKASAAATSITASGGNCNSSAFKSQDWVECETLGTHVEIPISQSMFRSEDSTFSAISVNSSI